jgi:hypothetical protein
VKYVVLPQSPQGETPVSIVSAQTCICIYPDGGAACDERLEWLRFQIQLAVQLGTQRRNPTVQNGLKHGTWNYTKNTFGKNRCFLDISHASHIMNHGGRHCKAQNNGHISTFRYQFVSLKHPSNRESPRARIEPCRLTN